ELEHRVGIDLGERRKPLNLRFGLLALGDVGEAAGGAQDAAVAVQRELRVDLHPANLSVLGQEPGLMAAILQLALDELHEDVAVALPVVMMDVLKKQSAQRFLRAKTGQFGPRGVER